MHGDIHPAVDQYVEAIASLEEDGVTVVAVRIAERLGKSRPTVSEMLDRLTTMGYVTRVGRRVALSGAGRERAVSVVRRQRLIECLLVEVLGLCWSAAHDEAGRMAAAVSADVEARLVELLGDPPACPHGNPIPGTAGPVPDAEVQFPLSAAACGTAVRLARVPPEIERDRPCLDYLEANGFVTGAVAVVRERGPDGTVVLAVRRSAGSVESAGSVSAPSAGTLALGPHLCGRLGVVATTVSP